MANETIKPYETKMKKSYNNLLDEYTSIRAGRANPHVLIMIQPWEASMVKAIEKAIMTSDIGINPTNDGKCIRLVFPELTEERRKDLAKDVKKKGEAAKVAVRNIRRDANDALKKMGKGGDVSEDEIKDLEEQVQKLTDKFIAEIDGAIAEKTKEIMTV